MTATSRPQQQHPCAQPNSLPDSSSSFAKFFERWVSEQSRDLITLRAAASTTPSDADLRRLVDHVVGHYEHYYRAKSAAASADVLPMFSPSWTSTTENLYLWIGGWRPTAAVHLLYSKSGVQFEAQLPAFLDGGDLKTDDLGGLRREQIQAADHLQRCTITREREIEEAAATAQESLATGKMVELAGAGGVERMEEEMEGKKEGMKRVLEMADALRIETLRAVVALLQPAQAVHFLVAAAELHLAVHEFGRRKDDDAAAAAE